MINPILDKILTIVFWPIVVILIILYIVFLVIDPFVLGFVPVMIFGFVSVTPLLLIFGVFGVGSGEFGEPWKSAEAEAKTAKS